ncbi:MAG: hypothetical protein WCA20_06715 [Candidatus Sulfotelmatobacter sp.]
MRILPIAPAQLPCDVKPEIKVVGGKLAPEIDCSPVAVRGAAGHQAQVVFRKHADASIGKTPLHLADEPGFVVLKFAPDVFDEFFAQRRAQRLRIARWSV